MHGRMPGWLALFLALLYFCAPALPAQFIEDRPKILVPREPPTQQERDRRESLKQYVLGLLCEREDRLIEALKALEEAARLDPEAAAVFRAQVPLLLALDRGNDAAQACKKSLALIPDDFETWFLAGRIHKSLGQFADAQKSLERGLATESIKEHPEVAQSMWLELGSMHELAEEVVPAIRAYTAAAAILDHPDVLLEHGAFQREVILARAAETYERIGNLQRKAKNYPEAIAAYQKAQQRSTDDAGRINYHLAQLCQEGGKLAEALQYLDAYLRRQPLGTEAYELKIALLDKLQRASEIVPWLEKAAATDQYNVGLKLLLAKHLALDKQLAQAEKVYLALADEAPTPEIYQGLFRVYQEDPAGSACTLELLNRTIAKASSKALVPGTVLASNQAKAMIAALRDDAALSKDLVRVAARPDPRPEPLQGDTVQLLAALADRHEMYAEAERFYRQVLRMSAPAGETLLYGGLLRVLWKGHKYEEIVQVCREGLARTKTANHVLFHADLAKAYTRLGQYDLALRAAESAVASAGDNERLGLQLLRVRILTQAGRLPQAETDCLGMLKKNEMPPGDALEIRYVLSHVYNTWKKLPQCEEQLGLILKSDPSNPTANNDLGYLWADQGKNLEQAEEMIRRALELYREQRKRVGGAGELKDNAAYVDSLAWVLYRRGKIEEARRELERASSLPDGDDPVIWEHLGDVYQQMQMPGPARSAWEKAVQLYEQEHRRTLDDHYRELLRKLQPSTVPGTR